MARPRTLRDSPRCAVSPPLSGVYASRGHRSAIASRRPRSLRTPVTVGPHAPRLRSPRPSSLSSPPPCRVPRSIPAARRSLSSSCSLLLPDGVASSEPRSVRADGIPGSERSAAPPPAGWGGALGAAERAGRWYPRFGAARRHCHALAGRGSAPRRPGGGARRPPFGRAAEPARSAACASPGHPPPHSARTPSTPRPCPALSSIPTALSSLLSPPAGWAGVLGAAERAGRRYPRFGAERRHCHASAGGRSASRRPGGGARRPPFGRAAERARSAARASSGHPPPHSALSPPRPSPAPPTPAARQKTKKSSADPPGRHEFIY